MFEKRKAKKALEQINEIIKTWDAVNTSPTAMLASVFDAINKDKNLLEYYFPEIDWSKVDKDAVYNLLFADKERTEKRRR